MLCVQIYCVLCVLDYLLNSKLGCSGHVTKSRKTENTYLVKGGGGGTGFYGSRILDKIGDGLWIFNFQPTGLWI